jgi:polyphosphate kinase
MSKFNDYKYFINRELSWIQFNKRVLEECQNTKHPLFERLRFISISSSNLDEFFMVRVGSLLDQMKAKFNKKDPSGLTPKQQLKKIYKSVAKLMSDECNYFNNSLKPALENEGIHFLTLRQLNSQQLSYIKDYYHKNIFPVITPMIIDRSTSFPLILNKSLNIGLLIDENGKKTFATVQVPSVLKRIIKVPSENGLDIIMLEDLIKANLSSLFGTSNIIAVGCYRITRNADLTLNEEGAEDLLGTIEKFLKKRRWGAVVRLEVEQGMDKEIIDIIEREIEVSKDQEYEINTPLDLTFLKELINIKEYNYLCYSTIQPFNPLKNIDNNDIFKIISKGDILLHHPYDSFDPIVSIIKQAAVDDSVLAIKQTLYRVSGDSPIVKALISAAENRKQVTVLVELKARFDEENNISWAKQLEKSGCHVIYGLVGLKTHCKLLLIVRKEKSGIKRYVHMGTGNYNDITAKIYTDIGLLSSNPDYGEDASIIFNMLSAHSIPKNLKKLCIAPLNLRERFLYLIDSEIQNALKGRPARIVAKMNSLVDTEIIENLYKASSAGVKIDLIVRGICCLKPNIPKISDNINVISIVGRFLEHSRIFYFYGNGREMIFLSSADWMRRNLDKRVELLFPIEDIKIKKRIKKILNIYLKSNIGTKKLNSDGTYSNIDKPKRESLDSQNTFYKSNI